MCNVYMSGLMLFHPNTSFSSIGDFGLYDNFLYLR